MDEKLVGFIVDDASQVITLKEEEIENPPEIITDIDRKYTIGIGKVNEKNNYSSRFSSYLFSRRKKKN